MYNDLLQSLGFSDKAANIYLALLSLGPSSVRKLAEKAGLNRGTVYDTLKWLQEENLVDYYEKDSKQYFVAEDPSRLQDLLNRRSAVLNDLDKKMSDFIPELKSIYDKGGERPVARYYEKKDVHKILEDVLNTCEKTGENLYRIYSTAGIRENIYDDFPSFSDARVAKGIRVKVIAIGAGGELRGLDERKWLEIKDQSTPTYIIIYKGKTAYISLNAQHEPVGVVIENNGVYETQKNIFDSLWVKL